MLHVVVLPNMQQQLGGNDCGLFAITFAVHMLHLEKVLRCLNLTKLKFEIISFHKEEKCYHFPLLKSVVLGIIFFLEETLNYLLCA